MVSTSAKIAFGLGSFGAVGVVSYFVITNILKPDKSVSLPKIKLSEQLIKDGFTLLNFESGDVHNTEWDSVLAQYKSGTKNKFEGINLLDESGNSDHKTKNINSLKLACKGLVEVLDFSSSYGKARRWCVVPKGVKDALVGKGRKVLNSEATKQDDYDFWKKKIVSYDGTTLSLEGITWNKTTENEKVEEMKKGCKALLEKATKTHDEAFAIEYEKAERWCVSE